MHRLEEATNKIQDKLCGYIDNDEYLTLADAEEQLRFVKSTCREIKLMIRSAKDGSGTS